MIIITDHNHNFAVCVPLLCLKFKTSKMSFVSVAILHLFGKLSMTILLLSNKQKIKKNQIKSIEILHILLARYCMVDHDTLLHSKNMAWNITPLKGFGTVAWLLDCHKSLFPLS